MPKTNIIDNKTRELVASIEHSSLDCSAADNSSRLVRHLTARTALPEIRRKYEDYGRLDGGLGQYPLDSDGFAESFDVLSQETEFYEHWQNFGVVVGKGVAGVDLCERAVGRIKSITAELSRGSCDLEQSDSYANLPADASGVPILSRGFFEIYHDDSLAQLRQTVRGYLQQVLLWGRADIWTTFDRYGVKLPGHCESAALPLHVDQNPLVNPSFQTVQGVLALETCPLDRGTLAVVPGSKGRFTDYRSMAIGLGEYVALDVASELAEELSDYIQPLPLRQGDLASWDSRTTHANTANISDRTRFVALIAGGPARQDDPAAVSARAEAFTSGLGSNLRGALMHASQRPRYTNPEALAAVRQPELLNHLGRLLYGQERYGSS